MSIALTPSLVLSFEVLRNFVQTLCSESLFSVYTTSPALWIVRDPLCPRTIYCLPLILSCCFYDNATSPVNLFRRMFDWRKIVKCSSLVFEDDHAPYHKDDSFYHRQTTWSCGVFVSSWKWHSSDSILLWFHFLFVGWSFFWRPFSSSRRRRHLLCWSWAFSRY